MVAVKLNMVHYWLDHLYGALMHRWNWAPHFFSDGWGGSKLILLEQLTNKLFSQGLANVSLDLWPPRTIRPIWRKMWETNAACMHEGIFLTPCDELVREALPPESQTARVRLLTPRYTPWEKMACVVHLAGTGDHGFERRMRLGAPLLKENIATMVLESPFYGNRRPNKQHGAKLLCVSDLLLLGRATIEEARALLYWMEKEAGLPKFGVCGLSMGGVHAAMVGSLHQTPIATVPLLSPRSAAVAFCEGILQHGTAWDALMRDAACVAMTREQVRERMRAVLSLTDVTRFPVPKNSEAVIFVAATNDGYVPGNSILELQHAWPGSEVRWVTGGHVSSFILHNKEFQQAIRDALQRV